MLLMFIMLIMTGVFYLLSFLCESILRLSYTDEEIKTMYREAELKAIIKSERRRRYISSYYRRGARGW